MVLDRVDEEGSWNLYAAMTEASRKEIADYAVSQNLTTLRNRVNELGVSEPLVQRQGQALAGDGVDVAGGIAHQQQPILVEPVAHLVGELHDLGLEVPEGIPVHPEHIEVALVESRSQRVHLAGVAVELSAAPPSRSLS